MEGINDVKEFLKNTKEIVIWANHHFSQPWGDAAHQEFQEILVREFGKMIYFFV
jgi:hypothetical protein